MIVVGDLPECGPHLHVWYWYTLVRQLDRCRQLLYEACMAAGQRRCGLTSHGITASCKGTGD